VNLQILPTAQADLRSGYSFYEAQSEGLGPYFFQSLFAEIEALSTTAGLHRRVFGFHRKIARRFPFAIYYFIDGGEVLVAAVLDCRIDPEVIEDRLRSL
jgi:plasmid stabilization system protein ParE